MSDLSALRMPEHNGNWDEPDMKPFGCRSDRDPGWAHMNPDGTLHCNACGWVTPEPVITTYSPDTDKTYLTWDELIAAESNGYVVVGLCSRPGTVPVVIGPWPASEAGKQEARKAQTRLRSRWRREEQREHGREAGEIRALVRVMWQDRRAKR